MGANRNARINWLPESLPDQPEVIWEFPTDHSGLGGLAVVGDRVFFGDRDLEDFHDVYRCHDAASGKTIWEVKRLSIASLDYGNSPRATPLVWNDYVFFQGAHGNLLCLNKSTGEVIWEKNFRDEYPADFELPWGYCASPLIHRGKLIISPGIPNASIVALDAKTGQEIWRSPGLPPGYGSFIVANLGGTEQIVGHDAKTLGGWDIATGNRLWSLSPGNEGDFNVPTPIEWDGQLIVATENNGCRVYAFEPTGIIRQEPVARNNRLRTDMSTPVVVGDRLFCVKDFLVCLDLSDELNERFRIRDESIGDYAAIVASDSHLLIAGNGELLLLRSSDEGRIISRLKVFDEEVELYSHFAIAGNRIFIRGEQKLVCLEL